MIDFKSVRNEVLSEDDCGIKRNKLKSLVVFVNFTFSLMLLRNFDNLLCKNRLPFNTPRLRSRLPSDWGNLCHPCVK